MTQYERDLGLRWFEEVWNKRRRDAIPEMLAPDGVIHEGGMDVVGPAGFYAFFDRLSNAVSDMKVTVHHTIAEGEFVCARWSATGAHTGPGLGIPPTGKTFHVSGISIIRVAEGMVAEGWQNWDMLGMIEQIQASPRAATYIATS